MFNNPFGIMLQARAVIGRTREEIPDIPWKKFVVKWRLSATAQGQRSHCSLMIKCSGDKPLLTVSLEQYILLIYPCQKANMRTVRYMVYSLCSSSWKV